MRQLSHSSVKKALASILSISLFAVGCDHIRGGAAPVLTTAETPPALHIDLRDKQDNGSSFRLDSYRAIDTRRNLNFEVQTDRFERDPKTTQDFDRVTAALIQYHVFGRYPGIFLNEGSINPVWINELFQTLDSKTSSLARSVKKNDLGEMKSTLDDEFAKMNGATETEYQEDTVGIDHAFLNNQLQCYSGTYLFNLVARKALGTDEFRRHNVVVIFRKHHVLPGYMEKTKDGFRLTGIETTMSGPSLVDFGMTDSLPQPIRVVDAEHFAMTEIMKDRMGNPNEVANEAIDYAAHRYAIKNPMKVEGLKPEAKEMALNESIFGIPDPDYKKDPTPKKREHVDKKTSTDKMSPNQVPGGETQYGVQSMTLMTAPPAEIKITAFADGDYVFKNDGDHSGYEIFLAVAKKEAHIDFVWKEIGRMESQGLYEIQGAFDFPELRSEKIDPKESTVLRAYWLISRVGKTKDWLLFQAAAGSGLISLRDKTNPEAAASFVAELENQSHRLQWMNTAAAQKRTGKTEAAYHGYMRGEFEDMFENLNALIISWTEKHPLGNYVLPKNPDQVKSDVKMTPASGSVSVTPEGD